jgi:hypothetical protein
MVWLELTLKYKNNLKNNKTAIRKIAELWFLFYIGSI